MIDQRQLFSPTAKVHTSFSEQIPLFNRGDIVRNLSAEVDAGFVSVKRAIKTLNPKFSDNDIDDLLTEIEEEKTISLPQSFEVINGSAEG